MPSRTISKREFEDLSDFRYALRQFLRFSEESARADGLTALQYQLLLQVKGARGRSWVLVGEVAERLQMHPHGAVALVSRCERAGLVRRAANRHDRRRVQIHLTTAGERALRRIALRNRDELLSLAPVLEAIARLGGRTVRAAAMRAR